MYGTEPRLVGGRYEIGEILGYGGMAEVYRGRDVRLGREVAVKTLRADLARDPTFHARFRREAQSSAALNHPSIVSVYDTGEDVVAGVAVPYIVMEYVEGRTLRDVLLNEGRLTEQRALEITSDVCAALDYSHRMDIVHRDIKPANVMLTPEGAIKVMDFGIARAMTASSSTMTQTAAVIGTAQYLSPEQARGETVDARSDIYTTGVLLYELLTGSPPFRGDNPVAVAYQHVRENPQPPSVHDPDISPQADAIVFKAMEKDREDRYQTSGQMRDDIERALSGQRVLAPLLGAGGGMTGAMAPNGATTRLAPGGGYGDPRYAGFGAGDRYGPPTGQVDAIGGPNDPGPARRSPWKYLAVAAAVILVFVLAALLAKSFLGTSGGKTTATAKIPADLVSQNFGTATSELKGLGFTDVAVTRTASKDVDKDQVISVNPAPGTVLAKDATVTLIVSSGPKSVTIPDLTGKTAQEATAALAALNLTSTQSAVPPGPGLTSGNVTKTDPPAGQSVAAGSSVTLYVVGTTTNVPSVVGQSQNDATNALLRAGFVPQIVNQPSTTVQTGRVISQSPPAGTAQAPGATITLTIAAQPSPSPTPSHSPSPSPSVNPTASPTPPVAIPTF